MKCPQCHFDSPEDTHFCGHCGAPLLASEKISVTHTMPLATKVSQLMPGITVAGRYKLLQELGRGGMGVVYKAKDTKLKREVALKFISPQILAGREEKGRFIREARAAAALSHPHICTVHEIDEHEGISFISMEFVEGKNLRDKVRSQPLKLADALDISIQVAEGLQQAHAKGIVHRDIKSANIMVSDKGRAKIMDFGLAKPAEGTQVTREGTTMGTVAYMSPEQAYGEEADFRTDIWSFGVVLYEIVAGRVPFRGDNEQAMIHSILNENPRPLTSLRSGVPLAFEQIVNKCLEKNPSYRYQTFSDLLADLRRLKRDLETGKEKVFQATPSRAKVSWPVKLLSIAASAVLISVAVYYLFMLKNSRLPNLPFFKLTPLTGGSRMSSFPSWSPDGAWVAYASEEGGNFDIWKKPVAGGELVQLTNTPENESQPAWSHDGRTIAFTSDRDSGGIFLIPSDGGTPWRLTQFGANPAWSPDNETLAFSWCGNIYLVPYTGGEAKVVVSGTSGIPYSVWTPDGKGLVYWNRTKGDVCIFFLADEKPKPLGLISSGDEVSGLSLSKDGQVLFLSKGPFGGYKGLWKVEFDLAKGKTAGGLIPLLISTTDDIQCAVSPDGQRIAFTACQLERHLWAFPRNPASGLISGKGERLTFRSKNNYYPSVSRNEKDMVWTSHLSSQGVLCAKDLDGRDEKKVTQEWGGTIREIGASFSPDGKQVSYSSTVGGSYEIWRMPSFGSVSLKLTSTRHPLRDTLTAWAPAAEVIVFYSNRSGSWDIWSIPASGKTQPLRLTQYESDELYPCWSPDGQRIAFVTDREGNPDIWIMNANGGDPHPFVVNPAEEGWSAWSPDGRWFYFISNRSGAFNVWVKPAGGGEEIQVTDYAGLASGLPGAVLQTKFVVTSTRLIVPLETLSEEIYILENIK